MRTAPRIFVIAAAALLFGAALGVVSMGYRSGGAKTNTKPAAIAKISATEKRSTEENVGGVGVVPASGHGASRVGDAQPKASAVAQTREGFGELRDAIRLDALEIALYSAAAPSGMAASVDPSRAIELRASENAGSSSVLLQGRDPLAPRALWLWRVGGDEAVLYSRGESLADGSLAFASAIVPRTGLSLIATPVGVRPGGEGASQTLRLPGRAIRTPVASLTQTSSGERLLRIASREPSAAIVLADAAGRELAFFPARGLYARRPFEISLNEYSESSALKVAHVFPNGTRSEWRSIEPWTVYGELE